jgi:hypothetical protein
MPRQADPNKMPIPRTRETALVWRVFTSRKPGERGLTAQEVAEQTGLPLRTAAARCLQLLELKLVEAADTSPPRQHRYDKKLRGQRVTIMDKEWDNAEVAKRLDGLLVQFPES